MPRLLLLLRSRSLARPRSRILASLVFIAACAGSPAGPDAPPGPLPDAADAPGDPNGLPLPGFGAISGACGAVDAAAIDSPDSALVRNAIDFAARPYTDADLTLLTPGGQEIFLDGNAGGSSIYSEMFAFEVLARCERADLLKTETEIVYDGPGKLTDFLAAIAGRKVGVSVTRAFAFPPEDPYTVDQARALLDGKLADILDSTAHVSAADAWVKQVLHILAFEPMHADSVAAAYAQVDPAVRADTIVVVTVSDGDDAFLY